MNQRMTTETDTLRPDASGSRPVPRADRRWDAACAVALVLITLATWAPRLRGPIDLRQDAGTYFVLGTSIARGDGYRLLNEPGEISATQYPPLLPAVVAAHQWATGSSDPVDVGRALRFTYCAMHVFYALAAYAMARQFVGPGWAFVAAVLAALSFQAVFASDALVVELPFMLVSTLCVLLHVRGQRASTARRRVALGAGAGALAVACFLLRTAGLALLAAWAGEALLRGRWKTALVRGGVALVPVIAWQAYVAGVRNGPEYERPAYAYQRAPYLYYNVSYGENVTFVDPFDPDAGRMTPGAWAGRVARGLASMPALLGEAVSAPRGFWEWAAGDASRWAFPRAGASPVRSGVVLVATLLLTCGVLGGLALLVARREWLIALYLGTSVLLTCMAPWPSHFPRYLSPLTPFLALALVMCLARVARAGGGTSGWRRAMSVAVVTTVVVLAVGMELFAVWRLFQQGHQAVTYYDSSGRERATGAAFYYTPSWRRYEAALCELAVRGGQGRDLLVTTTPHLAYLRTGCKAVMPPLEMHTDAATAQALLDGIPREGNLYLMIDDPTPAGAMLVVETFPDHWEPVIENDHAGVRVYRRTGRPAPATQSRR
ncbi:MAG: hypothetical protein ACREIT_04890 [Tepidisphaeraceae bacterium]